MPKHKRYTIAFFNSLGGSDLADALETREADTEEECVEVAVALLESMPTLSAGDKLVVIDNEE